MPPTRPGAPAPLVAAVLLCVLGGLAGCAEGAKTPEEAYERVATAVRTKDAGRLYDALDQETHWSIMTARRSDREAYDIILSNFPEQEQKRQLPRFERGALSDTDKTFFAATFDAKRWDEWQKALPASAPKMAPEGERATVPLESGGVWVFTKGPKSGRWGWAGLAEEAEQAKRRAIADLELIRNSAADYERAATRAGK